VLRDTDAIQEALRTNDVGNTARLRIGARDRNSPDAWEWNGVIDEVRVSHVVRSQDWIKASYTNQVNPSGFIILGSEEDRLYKGTIIMFR